jgi:hypothetical protein
MANYCRAVTKSLRGTVPVNSKCSNNTVAKEQGKEIKDSHIYKIFTKRMHHFREIETKATASRPKKGFIYHESKVIGYRLCLSVGLYLVNLPSCYMLYWLKQ